MLDVIIDFMINSGLNIHTLSNAALVLDPESQLSSLGPATGQEFVRGGVRCCVVLVEAVCVVSFDFIDETGTYCFDCIRIDLSSPNFLDELLETINDVASRCVLEVNLRRVVLTIGLIKDGVI